MEKAQDFAMGSARGAGLVLVVLNPLYLITMELG